MSRTAASKGLTGSLQHYYEEWRATLANTADIILPDWAELDGEQVTCFMEMTAATIQTAVTATRTLHALGVEMPDEP